MVFSWSGIGPESDGIRHEKTAELFDSLRFVRLCPIFVGLGCGKTGTTTILFIHFQTLAHAITIGVYDIRKICRLA